MLTALVRHLPHHCALLMCCHALALLLATLAPVQPARQLVHIESPLDPVSAATATTAQSFTPILARSGETVRYIYIDGRSPSAAPAGRCMLRATAEQPLRLPLLWRAPIHLQLLLVHQRCILCSLLSTTVVSRDSGHPESLAELVGS